MREGDRLKLLVNFSFHNKNLLKILFLSQKKPKNIVNFSDINALYDQYELQVRLNKLF